MKTKIKPRKWLLAGAILLIAGLLSLILVTVVGLFHSIVVMYPAILIVLGIVCFVMYFLWK